MSEWKFSVFIKLISGHNALEKWLDDEGVEVEEELDSMIKRLSVMRMELWRRPFVAKITKNIWEIRFSVNNKEYRPLGYFGPDKQMFTILIGASKKGGRNRKTTTIWQPANAIETAEERLKIVNSKRCICEYKRRKRYAKEPS